MLHWPWLSTFRLHEDLLFIMCISEAQGAATGRVWGRPTAEPRKERPGKDAFGPVIGRMTMGWVSQA